jgi:ATP-dependent Clp protease adaptor protein ClpS
VSKRSSGWTTPVRADGAKVSSMAGEASRGAAVLPETTSEERTEPERRRERPWLVVVWNDPVNLMSYVTFVFQKLFGYPKEKAEQLMLTVHHQGRAVVASGSREKAELDVFRLHEHGLWATLEREG